MALINCTECNKEISDKAVTCPNCGNPINNHNLFSDKVEEYLVCPNCNSKELHSEKSGFSGGKAFVGAALTGGIGLLAGTIGSNKVKITCLKCGHKFNAGDAKVIKQMPVSIEINDKVIERFKEKNSLLDAVKLHYTLTGQDLQLSEKYVSKLLTQNNIKFDSTDIQKEIKAVEATISPVFYFILIVFVLFIILMSITLFT